MYALIVCPLPLGDTPDIGTPDVVIAVDGGADRCAELGVPVHVAIGDMDSATPVGLAYLEREQPLRIVLPVDKDVSDFEVAVEWCNTRDPGEEITQVAVLGAVGGRLDHQLAVLGAMGRLTAERVVAYGPGETIHVLTDHTAVDVPANVTFSVMVLGAGARVSVTGAYWPLDRAEIESCSSLGLSNRSLDGGARVVCEGGKVAVIVTA